MSVAATSGSSGGSWTIPTPAVTPGGLRGVPPATFTGVRANAKTFASEFRRYRMNNRNHAIMTVPFDRVLTALSYIRGPLVNDWVDAQELHLMNRIDTTKTNPVPETDEVLWDEFEAAFGNAWADTSEKQNAHEQLRKLTMQGWDIDTYIATFERLALAAKVGPRCRRNSRPVP